MLHSFVLLADHIGMALENDSRNIFISWSCRLGNQHITRFICLTFEAVLCSEILQISYYMLFVSGFSWNRGNLLEEGKYFFRIHVVSILKHTNITY